MKQGHQIHICCAVSWLQASPGPEFLVSFSDRKLLWATLKSQFNRSDDSKVFPCQLGGQVTLVKVLDVVHLSETKSGSKLALILFLRTSSMHQESTGLLILSSLRLPAEQTSLPPALPDMGVGFCPRDEEVTREDWSFHATILKGWVIGHVQLTHHIWVSQKYPEECFLKPLIGFKVM